MLNNWNIYSKEIEMKKVVKLTEQDLVHLVKKVMDEQRIEGDNRVEKLIRKGIGLMSPSVYSPKEEEMANMMLDVVKNGKYKIVDPFEETKKDYIVGSIYFCSSNDCFRAKLKRYKLNRDGNKILWLHPIKIESLGTREQYILSSGKYNEKIFNEIMK
jgi:hypothetical protein